MAWFDSLVNAGVEVLTKQLSLTSNWGSLNSQLIATIAPCDKDGNVKGQMVSAPLTEANMSQQFNWTSPFENYTPESRNPTLAAALQSGMIVSLLKSVETAHEDGSEKTGVMHKMADFLQKGEGRTGITKMNSIQVFTGHEPLKIEGTLVFRAYADPLTEVTQPIQTLWQMAFPKNLASGETIIDNFTAVADDAREALQGNDINVDNLVSLVFPSEAPGYVAFKYRGITYAPMVIESLSQPLVNPTCALGDVFATVQISLGTQRSWDAKDIQKSRQTSLDQLVSDSMSAVSHLF